MLDRIKIARALRRLPGGTAVLASLLAAGCGLNSDRQTMTDAARLTGGNPELGRERIRQYGCGSCHTIPGVRGARALVGPPLTGIASRMYIAGLLANNPGNMMIWIQDPPSVDSLTAMPNVGVTEPDARDIAAYLYTLK